MNIRENEMAAIKLEIRRPAGRRGFIGGSDARIIMGSDEAALVRLWREKRGEAEPEDFSGNLIVQLGRATEELNRVATLASALAKAQAELVNPEKSLTATIRSGRPGEGERSFRYAPLASGLDIVRKTLGQHEIATVQTTAIDKETGVVNLSTMLAHASGEWIASDWPVCAVAETANPQRMGAALTYARRYALFTLVGIAGEDDFDAPDLCAAAPTPAAKTSMVSGEFLPPPRSDGHGRTRAAARTAGTPSDESAGLRDRLLGEIAGLQSVESATNWAPGALATKNQLTGAL
jgi:hypothetical protein